MITLISIIGALALAAIPIAFGWRRTVDEAGMARAMGIELLSEAQYRALQQLGEFDLKTSSWIATPDALRALGGALFCDRRYDRVFVYHNGAQSYYAARGFRGLLRV